jgi:anion-transporting  ArsA/GET3 family ATPase
MKELMSNASLLRFAMKGYALWQKVSRAADRAQRILQGKKEPKKERRDIDFEKVFGDIRGEAERIQQFLTDPEHSALVLVTLPERLPVEETVELHAAVGKLGMQVRLLVVNKVQPDALGAQRAAFQGVAASPARSRFVAGAAKATGQPPQLVEAMVTATEFSEVRRAMNLAYVEELRRRLPSLPLVEVPLAKRDVQGLERLGEFSAQLFAGAGSKRQG